MRQSSQFNGGFYSDDGRKVLLPSLVRGLIEGKPHPKSFETGAAAGQGVKQAS